METRHTPLAAAGFMLLASSLIAGTTLMAKLVGRDVLGAPLHPLQISHGRFMFAFLAISTVVAITRPKIRAPNLPLHVARSVAGWTGISLLFAAVTFIPLADATAISFLNPVFAMLLAIPLLGERVGPWRWIAAAIALSGAVILIQPGAGSFHPAALLAMAAAAVMGLEITLIKRLADPVDQQRHWPDRRDFDCDLGVDTADRGAMGGAGGAWVDDGFGAGVLHPVHETCRSKLCRALFLCHACLRRAV